MATFGRARRTSGGAAAFGRPLVVLLAVSLGLLLLRDTAVVRGAAAGATDLLVPVERVLGAIGAPVSHAWQAVTETGSSVSALVQGSRAAGLVRGQFGDTLVMDWILQTEDVKVGDIIITAGLAIGDDVRSLYPKGLVLGKVVDVAKGDNGTYRRAILVPAVDLRHLENVLVVRTSS